MSDFALEVPLGSFGSISVSVATITKGARWLWWARGAFGWVVAAVLLFVYKRNEETPPAGVPEAPRPPPPPPPVPQQRPQLIRPVVPAAAAPVRQGRVFGFRVATGRPIPYPPGATRSGKRFYIIVTPRLGTPAVYCGWDRFQVAIGDRWARPNEYFGFPELEEAVAALPQHTGSEQVSIFL